MSIVNKFKSSSVAGTFNNVDLPNSQELAFAYFQRDIQVDGNIINLNLNTLIDSKVNTTYFDDFVANLNLNLDSKASLQYVDDEITTLNNLIDTKANISYVDDKISQLVDSSPETLDTLSELANALGNNENFATTVSNNIGLKADKTYTDNALNLKANVANPSFTGTANIVNLYHTGTIYSPAIQNILNNYALTTAMNTALSTKVNTNSASAISSYLHFGNHAQAYTGFSSQNFGAISVNKMSGGNAEMNFIQNGSVPGATLRAFNFMIATSNTSFTELMRINKNGDMVVSGNISSPNLTVINDNILLKSDKTYVDNKFQIIDSELLLKDTISSVNTKLSTKSDLTYVDNKFQLIDSDLLLKDTISSVNTKLSTKSDLSYVDNKFEMIDDELLLKSNLSYVNNAISAINNEFTTYDTEILNLQNQINNIEGNYNPNSDVSFQNLTVSGTITNTSLTNSINSKANVDNPTFTGTSIIPIANTNTINCNGQIYFHTGNINTPSSRIHIGSTDNMFWDNVLNERIHWRWGVSNSIKQLFYANGDISIPGSILNCPTITTINNSINLKADKTYTDNQLLFKTDKTFTDNAISTINSQLSLKADATQISNINNTSDVNKPISTAQQNALNLKANIASPSFTGTTNIVNLNHTGTIYSPAIQNILNNYALTTAMNTSLNLKANIDNPSFTGTTNIVNLNHTGTINSPAIQNILNNYALTTVMNTALSTKVNTNSASTISSYLHFANHAQAYTGFSSQNFGAISVNKMSGGNAEMNFIQNGFVPGATLRAFNFMIATSNTSFTELMRINKNGDMVVSGNISSPNLTVINNSISLIQTDIVNINNEIDLKDDITSVNSKLALKDDITSVDSKLALKDDITSVNSKLSNYALLNSSPTFTGTIKGKVYSGDLSRSASNIVFTAATLPSTILQDTGVSDTTIGIPNMPIGTRFTVMKTSPTVILYSTDSNVYFYSRRTSPFWQNILTMREDSRTFIRAEIINPSNLAMIQVWMTESSHIYNLYDTINTSIIGAFMLDGPNNGRTATAIYRPITCSNKIFGPGNSDDGYIVNEGFSLIVYDGENYTGTFYTLSNYMAHETPKPLHFPSPMVNNMQSCKLYYNLVEVVIAGISD